MKRRRTYWHLEPLRRAPSEYDITTSKLLYRRPEAPPEVRTPAAEWRRRHAQSELGVEDWERFRDPRETTYASYVEFARAREGFVDSLFRSMHENDYDRGLSAEWLRRLEALLPVLRFPCHGLQMIAAYLGHAAPASRIVIGCLFQTGDEIRRIQRICQRMRMLAHVCPGFGERSRLAWQEEAAWQPLRKVIELLLVTYDFGEAFVALNLVVKPAFERIFTVELARLGERNGDHLLGELLFSFREDSAWHRDFSRELLSYAVEEHAANQATIERWIARWQAPVAEAVLALEPLFDDRYGELLRELDIGGSPSIRAPSVEDRVS